MAQIVDIKKSVENPRWVPFCICDGEIFIQKPEDKGGNLFSVIRVVDKESFEYFRTESGIRQYYKEIWQSAVAGDRTECSLSEFIDDQVDLNLEDPDWVPNKDEYGCDVFDEYENLRGIADELIGKIYDVEVGTWESSGAYRPDYENISVMFNIV